MGKNHDFDTNVFLRSLNSFQTRNFNCSAAEAPVAEVTKAIFKTNDCLFTFISPKFFAYDRQTCVLRFCFKSTE